MHAPVSCYSAQTTVAPFPPEMSFLFAWYFCFCKAHSNIMCHCAKWSLVTIIDWSVVSSQCWYRVVGSCLKLRGQSSLWNKSQVLSSCHLQESMMELNWTPLHQSSVPSASRHSTYSKVANVHKGTQALIKHLLHTTCPPTEDLECAFWLACLSSPHHLKPSFNNNHLSSPPLKQKVSIQVAGLRPALEAPYKPFIKSSKRQLDPGMWLVLYIIRNRFMLLTNLETQQSMSLFP